ncbi:MAG: hypothetical protein Q8N98_01275 [bacterium]|nr:hypothetical protein [bacterium]
MEIVKKNESKKTSNSPQCLIYYAYETADEKINGAVVEIDGRYPANGRVKNEISRELIFVLGGVGKIAVEGEKFSLARGDLAIISPNERYCFSGKLKLFVANTPKWTPREHRAVA